MLCATLVMLHSAKSASQVILLVFIGAGLLIVRQDRAFVLKKKIFLARVKEWWWLPLIFLMACLLLAACSIAWSVAPTEWLFRFPKLVGLTGAFILALFLVSHNIKSEDALITQNKKAGETSSWILSWQLLSLIFLLSTLFLNLTHLYFKSSIQTMNRVDVSHTIFFWLALIGVYLAYDKTGQRIFWTLLLTLPLVSVLFLSNSQTSALALAGGMVAFIMTRLWPKHAPKLIVTLAALTAFFIPLLIYSLQYIPADWQEISFFKYGASAHRIHIWLSTLEAIAHAPFTGWGIDASRQFDTSQISQRYLYKGSLDFGHHPHNMFLQLWLEMGVGGALLLSLLVWFTGLQILKINSSYLPFAIALFSCIICIMHVSHSMWQTWWLSTLIIVIVSFPVYAVGWTDRNEPPVLEEN